MFRGRNTSHPVERCTTRALESEIASVGSLNACIIDAGGLWLKGETEPIRNNGMGMLSINAVAKAAFISTLVRDGLLASDEDTAEISKMRFENTARKVNERYNGIEIKANTNKTIEQQLQIEKWLPGHLVEQFKRKNIHSVKDIQIDGKIDTQKLFALQIPALMANTCLTAHDSNTLRPELLELLQVSDVKPKISYKVTNGEIRAFTDGSWLEKERRGTYAVLFDGAPYGEALTMENVYSSFEM